MKQKRLFSYCLSLLLVMMTSLPVFAEDLLVNDGTATNSYVPFYGYYADTQGGHNQFIIPSADLADMENGTITGMTFFTSTPASESWTATWNVRLMETTATTLSALADASSGTLVYAGTFAVASNQMALTFSDSYSYAGGNLLVDIEMNAKGSDCASVTWYGVSAAAGSSFHKYSSYSSGQDSFLPKVQFEYEAGGVVTCPKVGAIVVGTPATDNMLISWTKGGSESSWLFYLDGVEETVSDTFKILNGLTSNTEYSVAVRAMCSATDTAKARSAKFTTPCGIEALPFVQDFNSLTSGIPSCWDNSEGSTSNDSYKWNYYSSGVTGACVRFNSYNNPDEKTNFLATPSIALTADAQLEYAWKNQAAGDLEVYIEKGGVRTLLATHAQTGSSAWSEEAILLSEYTNDTVQFIFKGTSNYGSTGAYIYLDNIKVRQQPNCKKVSDIHAENPTLNGFDIAWISNGSESAWDVVVANGTDTLFNGSVSETKVTLSSLTSSTAYSLNVSVIADCGAEKAEAKEATIDFATQCDIILAENDTILLGAEGFATGALPVCYETGEYASTYSTYKWEISSSYCKSGSRCFKSPSAYSDAAAVLLTLPQMEIPENSEISLWAREGYSSKTSDSLVIYVNDSATLTNATCLGVVKGLNSDDYQFFRFPLTDVRGDMYIMIEHHGYYSMYVDDIMISPAPSCFPVTHLTLGEVLTSSASFSWQAGGEESAWIYSYSFMTDDSTIVAAEDQEAEEMVAAVEGLTPATHYSGTVSVKALCDGGFESEVAEESFEFTTMCEPEVISGAPADTILSYDFEDWEAGQSSKSCWDIFADAGSVSSYSSYISVWNANGLASHSGTFGLRMNATTSYSMKSAWLVLPVMSVAQADEYELSFWASRCTDSSDDSISVYVSNCDDVDSARFVAQFTNITTSFQNFSVLLPAGEHIYVMIKGSDKYTSYSATSKGLNLDDIIIRRLPACRAVKDIKVSDLGTDFAEIAWTAGNEETEWNATLIHGTDTVHHNGLTESKIRLDSLADNTAYTYKVKVVAICDGQPAAEFAESELSFRTLCLPVDEFPITYGFESSEGFTSSYSTSTNNLPACWGNETKVVVGSGYTSEYLWFVYSSTSTAHSGSNALCLPDKGKGSRTLLSLPPMLMEDDKDYELSLWVYRSANDTVAEGFRVYASHSAVFNEDEAVDLGVVTRMYSVKTAVCDSLSASGWDHIIIPIPMTGNVTLFFMGESYYKSSTYVDDIIIREKPLCEGASSLMLVEDAITASSATFAWNGSSDAGYDVRFIIGSDTINKHVADTFCVLDGLQSSLDYSVAVSVTAQCVAGAAVDVVERSFTFATECVAIADVPWSYDFESAVTSSYSMPACWNSIKYSSYPYVASYSAYEGSNCLYFYGGASSRENYAILPEFASAFDWANARIKFMYKNTNTDASYAFLTLGYMTDPEDAATFVALDTLDKVSAYTQYEYYLTDVPDATSYLALRLAGGTSQYAYVDNIAVTEIPSCLPGSNVHVIDSTITGTSAQIAWTAYANEPSWKVVVLNGKDTMAQAVVSDTIYTLEGLVPSSAYNLKVMVYSICEGGAVSIDAAEATVDIQTTCQLIASFPWAESFEGYAANATSLACMRNEHIEGTGTNLFKVYTTANGTNATHQLSLPDQKATEAIMLALPEMNIPEANAYEFSMDIYRNTSSKPAEGVDVYVSTTDTLDASAQKLGFLSRDYTVANEITAAESASGWYTYRMAIPVSGNCHIIIRSQSQWGSATYMDNFQVAAMPNCRKVSGILMDKFSKNSADFSWTPGAKETEWQIIIKNGADTLANATIQDVPQYQLTGLTAGTAYNLSVEVQSCGEYSEIANFALTTFCEALEVSELPWIEDFNAGTKSANIDILCFQNNHVSGLGTKLFTYGEEYASKDSTLMLCLPDMAAGTLTQLILPTINIPQANKYGFSLDIYRSSYDKDKEGVRVLAQNADTTMDLGFLYRQYTRSDGNIVLAESASGLYHYEFPIPLTGEVTIILQGESQFGSATYMDNLMMRELPSCIKPAKLHVSEIGLDTARIVWEGEADSYKLVMDFGSHVDSAVVADTCYVIRGLNHSTVYSIAVSVQSLCGESEVSEALTTTLSFTTECALIDALPWSIDFENETTYQLPVCWSRIPYTSGSSVYPYVNGYTGYDESSKSLYFYGGASSSKQIAILPEFDSSVDLSTARIKFAHKCSSTTSYYASLEFGYMTDPEADSTFVVLATLSKLSSWSLEEIMLDSVPADAHFLAFRLQGGTYFQSAYVDAIEILKQNSCKKISDLQLFSVSETEATFTWTAGASEPQWQVSCQLGDELKLDTVTAATYTIHGLAGMTQYTCTLSVKALCSEEESSDVVSSVFKFKTNMPASAIEQLVVGQTFIANFDDDDEIAKWMQESYGTNKFVFGSDAAVLSGSTATSALYISDDSTAWNYTISSSSNSVIYRRFHVVGDSAILAVNFEWQANGEKSYGTYDYGRALIVPGGTAYEAGSTLKIGGSTMSGSSYSSAVPAGCFDLANGAMVNVTAFQAVADTITLSHAGDYDIAFVWTNDGSGGNQYPLGIRGVQLKLISVGPGTGFQNMVMPENDEAIKIVRDGKVYILRRGEIFTILGSKVAF